MRATELLGRLAANGVAVTAAGYELEVSGESRALTASMLECIRRAKPDLLVYLASPEARWPEFATSIRMGTMVFCLRCRHYEGPARQALGYCRTLKTEAAPDVPFDCPSFNRLPVSTRWGSDMENWL